MRHKKRTVAPRGAASRPVRDSAVYWSLVIVGVFVVIIAALMTDGLHWREIALGYVAAILYLVNFYALQVYRGKHVQAWKQSLARVPLRIVDYGTKSGKPLEAAHGQPRVKTAIVASLGLSLLILFALSVALFPQIVS